MNNGFTDDYIHENLMGPNAVLMARELCGTIDDGTADPRLENARRICDLGCGAGITSMWLAQSFSGHVWGCDLWNTEEENAARFDELGFADRITAVQSDALELPFPDGCFDALVSIDSYNYFGREEGVIDRVARFVAPGAPIFIAVPGLKHDLTDADMDIFGLSWTRGQMEYICTAEWWAELIGRSDAVRIDSIGEMDCFDRAWSEWLACDNEYAVGDRAAMQADAGNLMNLIAIKLTHL
jgi:SAM-dependent methyltransferase